MAWSTEVSTSPRNSAFHLVLLLCLSWAFSSLYPLISAGCSWNLWAVSSCQDHIGAVPGVIKSPISYPIDKNLRSCLWVCKILLSCSLWLEELLLFSSRGGKNKNFWKQLWHLGFIPPLSKPCQPGIFCRNKCTLEMEHFDGSELRVSCPFTVLNMLCKHMWLQVHAFAQCLWNITYSAFITRL